MAVHIRFRFFGEDQVSRSLLAYAERAGDMRPAWEELRDRFVGYEEKWFDSEGDGRWPPLSASYAEWKARHFPGRKTLVREGDLKASVLKPDIEVMEPTFAMFGTADPVAGYHQKGDGRLPMRRVIDLSEEEKREWIRVVQRYLAGEDL
jgi:phage gpG-like protein